MADKPRRSNCYVVEVYKGINIRKVNEIKLHLSPRDFKAIIDTVILTGLSIPKVIAYSGKPCDKCQHLGVTVFDEEGNATSIKRGILPIPGNSGTDIVTKAKNRIK